jgi:flagellar hook protein FlgE
MSMGGILGAAASGISAQSIRLTAIADNVANASTTGYKNDTAGFYSMVEQVASPSNYNATGVSAVVRHNIATQGVVDTTNSPTDLAVQGNGFFVVTDGSGSVSLTRSGSFVPDAQGRLVNGAGFYLNAVPAGASPSAFQPVVINMNQLSTAPTRTASLNVNLDATSTAVSAANLPSTNSAGASYSSKTSVIAYDNTGAPVTLDLYMTKTTAGTWDVAAYNQANATNGGFPYSSGPLATSSLSFSGSGVLQSGGAFSVPVPGGQNVAFDLSGSTQYAAAFNVVSSKIDGHAPAAVDHVSVGKDGTISEIFSDGSSQAIYKIPLATVASPDLMGTDKGTTFKTTADSGPMQLQFAQQGGSGTILGSSLEESTVDLATELTDMIQTQRAYQANSKTFQAGADLLDVLVNLK